MKSTLLSLLLIVIGSSAFAQGAAPFWEPLPGPSGSPGAFTLLPDSQLVTLVGGTAYKYLSGNNNWVPASGSEGNVFAVSGSAPHYAHILLRMDKTLYASYLDTVYFSSDFGSTWKSLGSYGHPRLWSIITIVKAGSNIIIFNDSNTFFVSSNNFVSIDTEHAPELPRYLWTDSDTLIVSTVYGKLFRSTDFGIHWNILLDLHDSAQNFLILTRKNTFWILQAWHHINSPQIDSDIYLGYSTDHGKTWTSMTVPKAYGSPSIAGIDDSDRIYLRFGLDSSYRSDNLGATWQKIANIIESYFVTPDGTLYASGSALGNSQLILRSTNHGATWDTLGSQGILGAPFNIVSWRGEPYLSTTQSIFHTSDFGLDWTWYFGLSGNLTLLPDQPDSLVLNTITVPHPPSSWWDLTTQSGGGGLGAITTSWNFWWVATPNGGTMYEASDRGSSISQLDTLSTTPIAAVMETSNDTILVCSSSALMKGYSADVPFTDVSPGRGSANAHPPTGALARDSTGAIYAATSDGKLFVTRDGANSWQEFLPSPSDASAPVQHLAAGPAGWLFAVDSNRTTGLTSTMIYDPGKAFWRDVTTSLTRQNFSGPAVVTNIWYIHNYVWAGTWNMGLFRSFKPIVATGSVAPAGSTARAEIYPNPAESLVTVSNPTGASGWLTVVDVTGRTWQRIAIVGGSTETQLNVESLPAGVYCVRITLGDVRTIKLEKE